MFAEERPDGGFKAYLEISELPELYYCPRINQVFDSKEQALIMTMVRAETLVWLLRKNSPPPRRIARKIEQGHCSLRTLIHQRYLEQADVDFAAAYWNLPADWVNKPLKPFVWPGGSAG